MNLLVEILMNLFDAVAGIGFVTQFCKITGKKRLYAIPATIAIFAVSNVFLFVNIFSVVHSLIITALLYAYCLLCKTKEKVRVIFAPLIFEIVLIIVNSIFLSLFAYLFDLNLATIMASDTLARYLFLVFSKAFIVSILLIILKFSTFTSKFNAVNLLLYLGSPVFTVYTLYVFISISLEYDLNKYVVQVLISFIGLALINLFTIILFEISNRNAESKQKYEFLQHQMHFERESYQGMITASENLHKIRHDIKNHLLYIRNIIDKNEIEKAEEYIEKITNDMQDTDKYMVTGNRTLDYILSSKITENKEINFICAGNCVEILDHMEELDVAMLFGNLIDNAIEAVEGENEKFIEIRISTFHNFCNIHISNPFSKSILKDNPQLMTTKKDADLHGWGLKSVRSVVEKYCGLFDYYEKNGKFTVHISIPINV